LNLFQRTRTCEHIQESLHSVSSDSMSHPLDFIWLEVTPKCNLECIHCYASSNMLRKEYLNTADWLSILLQGFQAGCKGVQFIGGEPTLFKDLIFLIRKSRELGYEYVELYTNATLLTKAMLDELNYYNVELATSFYSHTPEIHDEITQRKGSFHSTVEGIKKIIDMNIPLRVGLIRLPQNATDLEAATEVLVHLGVMPDKVLIDRVRGHGRGAMIVNEHNEYSGLCGYCGDGRLAVSSDGSVYPCVHARQFKLGNALQDPLGQIAASRQLVEFRRAMIANLDDHVRKALLDNPEPCRGV
jgi:MoaA/NifB/PqqE/SkfB family radical SAM enzyme